MRQLIPYLLLIVLLATAGCAGQDRQIAASLETDSGSSTEPSSVATAAATVRPTATPSRRDLATSTAIPTATTVATATITPTTEPTSTPIPTASPTPDPLDGLAIDTLQQEQFGQEGEIEIVETLETRTSFTRYRIVFPSDGLRIEGFMNVPTGEGPFPVVIVNHGYMPPASYQTLTYTTKYADALAAAGFLTIHPNFRNHRGSDHGPNPYRTGYTRDVLHLIPMAQRLPEASDGPVGMWGHSMGGGVTLRALTISDQIAAAVLYASMSGDEAKNYRAVMRWSGGAAAQNGSYPHSPDNQTLYQRISPLNFVDRIKAAIEIHHGVRDDQVPFEWSEELAQQLETTGVRYEFYRYPSQGHNFTGNAYELLNQRVVTFFRKHLR